MKTIEPIIIWSNGQNLEAGILNAYAVNVTLGSNATFFYSLIKVKEDGSADGELRNGNLLMTGDAYAQWQIDSYAWDWIALQLNLTITGDYVPPVPPPTNPENLSTII